MGEVYQQSINLKALASMLCAIVPQATIRRAARYHAAMIGTKKVT